MTRHMKDDRLQDYLEGLLPAPEAEEVEAHLEGCPRCRRELESMASLLEEIKALPEEALPGRDLWPQIAWRIGASGEDRVGEENAFPDRASRPLRTSSPQGRRISLPAWQLLAASVAVAVISGSAVWAFLSSRGAPTAPVAQATEEWIQPVNWREAFQGYSDAATDLEVILDHGRGVLDPETVRVLEESLTSIDEAIDEAREALTLDPASPVLRRFLADHLRRKIELLRQAAQAIYANT